MAPGDKPAGCNFDYAGTLTEIVLLGNIAVRCGEKLYWDADNLKITNNETANRYINEPYNNGWILS